MRYDFGTVFKNLRKAKGISQKDICSENFSVATLSRIENNLLIPPYDRMIYLLNQLDISVSEFEYLCSNYKEDERSRIISTFHSIHNHANLPNLQNLLADCKRYLLINDDLKILEIQSILEIFVHSVNETPLKLESISNVLSELIWTRLKKSDIWTYSDLFIITSHLHLLPFETTTAIFPRIVKAFKRYENFENARTLNVCLHLNYSAIYLKHGLFSEGKNIVERILPVAHQINRVDFIGILLVHLGIFTEDTHKIEEGLMVLRIAKKKMIIEKLTKVIPEKLARSILTIC
ncbi:hypothetical protein A5844_002057 [Enterococcus sp. 10A9_DIV0425]|uniref:HTH cro/C1-type domain-containing protein n=1 Tax=Candidatus Enterococcus wittei TaxID=1987383 RepID=A0A242JYG3_9ENTE|nr:Rgg/GadR/MutR family transcriptional regulator [Enterococcus sp. 10A9_DIV0425]OTP10357.1 hypothetical protein A5844_002057 [Enterococcus sp. 10A9_DIV0425]